MTSEQCPDPNCVDGYIPTQPDGEPEACPRCHRTEDLVAAPMAPVLQKTETSVAANGVQTVIYHYLPGMTKREYYASMAMLGFTQKAKWEVGTEGARNAAHWAVVYADALVEELSQ